MRTSEGKARIGAVAILSVIAFAIETLAALTLSHAQLATSPWPMFHHDTAHTGLSQFDTSANPGYVKWKFTNGGAMGDPVIGDDGTIYAGCGANLCAVNPDGTQKWAFADINGGPADVPAIDTDGNIWFGDGNYFYAINPDGSQKWSRWLSAWGFTSPAIGGDGTVYTVEIGKLIGIALGSGVVDFNQTQADSSPAIGGDGTVYAIMCIGAGYGLGALPPAFDYTNPIWVASFPFSFDCDYGGTAAIGSDGTLYVNYGDGNLYAVNSDGSLKWEFANGGFQSDAPSIGPDGTIYIGSSDQNLHALTDGGQGIVSQKWAFKTAGTVNDPAIGSDGTVYVGSADDNLYAVTSGGLKKWALATGGTVGRPAIGADGTVYVGSGDNNLYAVGTCPCATPTATTAATATATATATPTPIPGKLTFSPHSISFGKTVTVGTTSKPKTVTIKNAGKKKTGLAVNIGSESASPSVFAVTSQCNRDARARQELQGIGDLQPDGHRRRRVEAWIFLTT